MSCISTVSWNENTWKKNEQQNPLKPDKRQTALALAAMGFFFLGCQYSPDWEQEEGEETEHDCRSEVDSNPMDSKELELKESLHRLQEGLAKLELIVDKVQRGDYTDPNDIANDIVEALEGGKSERDDEAGHRHGPRHPHGTSKPGLDTPGHHVDNFNDSSNDYDDHDHLKHLLLDDHVFEDVKARLEVLDKMIDEMLKDEVDENNNVQDEVKDSRR